MIDKLMLQDVKNILEKIKIVKSSENYVELLTQHGIDSTLTGEELDREIVAKMMSEQESQLFTRYIKYRRHQNLNNMRTSIEYLVSSKYEISDLYVQRNEAQSSIEANQNHIERVLEAIDSIEAESLLNAQYAVSKAQANYHHLEKTTTAKEKSLEAKIERVKKSRIIIPALKSKLVQWLQNCLTKMLIEHKNTLSDESFRIEDLQAELDSLIFNFCIDLLNNSLLQDAIILNDKGINTETVTPVYYANGVRSASNLIGVESSVILERLQATIRQIIAKNPTEANFNGIMKRWLVAIYQEDIESFKEQKRQHLSSIQKEYAKQQELIKELGIYQSSFEIQNEEFTQDEQDTLAIAYKHEIQKK